MHSPAITHARLMQESEGRLEALARTGTPAESFVARRVVETPAVWMRWANEHSTLMRSVASQRRPARQSVALKRACFSLVHRKALFEHLRQAQVGGQARQQLLGFFHRTRGYTQAMIAEHDNYLRSAGSYLCTSYLGSAVVRDGVYQDPLRRYEKLYREYFRLFCDGLLVETATEPSSASLLPYLKYQIRELRLAIIAMPRRTPALFREDALRTPTGDTEKLRVDALRADFRQ
jgi:hypothetical protein